MWWRTIAPTPSSSTTFRRVIPTIDRLLTQLDRKTQEVEIEARVVAATRQFARDIGTQLGLWLGQRPQRHRRKPGSRVVADHGQRAHSGLHHGAGIRQRCTGSSIPLFSNLGVTSPSSGLSFVNASNTVRIDAVLSLAESRGLLKVLSRPRVVTQNNIQALVKQGVRVPIVTQAQLGGPPTVTYVDAFLRLTVTPQITSENTIFLNVDVENTTPNFGQEVQGNPELITQQATTQVLVTDGGTVVIGGVIQTQNSINISQVPLLGNLPVPGQPVQAHAGQHLQPGADFLHHAANHSDIAASELAASSKIEAAVLKNLSGRRFRVWKHSQGVSRS